VELHATARLEQEERKRRNRSLLLTALITMLLVLSGFIVLWRDTVPPGNQVQYRTVGAVDFGNQQEGSQDVNTKQKPSPKPKPDQKKEQVKQTPQKQEEVVTQEESPVSQPKAKETQAAKPQPKDEPVEAMQFDGGGSNQGDAQDQAGNRGQPKAKQFSKGRGGYKFGDMKGLGFYGAGPEMPRYDVEEEGQIVFELKIGPDGVVRQVKAVQINGNLVTMKNRTKEKLQNTRFTNPTGKTITIRTTWTYIAR
jgi:outer membrane biosynthesis protein TonB